MWLVKFARATLVLSDEALKLHVRLIDHCRQTDCTALSVDAIKRLGPAHLIDELVQQGLWELDHGCYKRTE